MRQRLGRDWAETGQKAGGGVEWSGVLKGRVALARLYLEVV